MKTLAVLSALMAIAIAAPKIEDYADSTRFSPGDFVLTQREKKSTTLEEKNIPEHLEDHTSEQALNKEGSNFEARTFSKGFNKPIVVKKIGYHAIPHHGYRDLGEEQSQLDSQEKCRKQMKAKFCEENDLKDNMKSASVDHHDEISEREMVHSINIAKEAVHTFERDLQRMEHECAEHKHRHATLGTDAQLHHDIEKAREALEHIHTHFKNVKSDEEKRTKWKEAGKLDNNVEIGKNLEDNFKNSGDTVKDLQTTIEDIDTPLRSINEAENGMTSIVEDKNRKLKIHSDNLIKASTTNEDNKQKLEDLSGMEHQARDQKEMTDKNVHNQHQEVEENKERAIESQDSKKKLMEIKEDDTNMLEKQTRSHLEDTEKLKSSDDHSSSDIHALTKELEKENSHAKLSHGNEQMMHGMNQVNTMAKTSTLPDETDENKKEILHQMDLQRSMQMQMLPQKTELHNLKSVDQVNMDTQRSSMAISKLDNEKGSEKSLFKNHMDHHENKDLRATSDFHKDLLNNMDFIEDSHHMALHQPSLTDKNQMMKNEKQELQERINVPGVHPNTEHLKTMMHFSDNSENVNQHLKMASMFDNQEPDMNVQINSPQDFVEQTNIQDFMPFRTTGDLHDMGLDKRLKTIHEKDNMPTELHDPLTVHRAHLDNMKMDGSSQHFNIEPLNNLMNDHRHLSLNEQLRMQQKWAQAKSIHHDHMHAHDTLVPRNNGHLMMMNENSNMDGSMQPSSLMQMRGTPKMSLERKGGNQWANTHGAYRSSYGPSLSPSYGSSYSGSAVGVFPNANVGNCAVPILLSCSPSVVSGSLAKSPHAYTAPAYRSEDINFLKKRGVDVDELTQGHQLRHTPQEETKVILEKSNKTA